MRLQWNDDTIRCCQRIDVHQAQGRHTVYENVIIDTEDGDLYVSFWNSGDDYSIMTQDELDEYIESQGMKMGGM